MKNQILILLVFTLILSTINASPSSIIYTPSGYYNLNKFNRYSNDIYYPDICNDTIPNMIDPSIEQYYLWQIFFPGAPDENANLLITKDVKMISLSTDTQNQEFINILCIEGSLEMESNPYMTFHIGAIVILPGGSLTMSGSQIKFKNLNPENSKIDPFNFFPGLLSLGGTLTMRGKYRSFYQAKRVDGYTLSIPDLIQVNPGSDTIQIYSETFVSGQTCVFIADPITKYINITTQCLSIPQNDKKISVYFSTDSFRDTSSYPIIQTISNTRASIYITGDTNIHIENYRFINLGKTNNKPYNDTQLTFSLNDPNNVTDIIMGSNQRFRNSIYIGFSGNSTIINNLFEEKDETRSPLLICQSKVSIRNNIFSSKSGSSIIAQFGNENIQSSNNAYYLTKPSSTTFTIGDQTNYGFEGNGIYSLSPNVSSTNDLFIGHSNAFKFNFFNNNHTTNSFDIINSGFVQQTNSNTSNNYLISIVGNKQQPNNFFTFNSLTATEPINIETSSKSVLIFNQLVASNKFSINSEITRLDIINSNINSIIDIKFFKSPKSTSIINSYIYGKEGSIQLASNRTYGSIIIPYYYNDTNTFDQLKISSIFPNEPYQIVINSTLNVYIKLESKTSSPINQISCTISGNNITQIKVTADQTDNRCFIPVYMDKEGKFKLRVTIANNTNSNYLYSIDLPEIIVYKYNNFYYGLRMVDPLLKPSSLKSLLSAEVATTQTIVEGNLYQDGCQQQNNCSLSSNNNNIKYQSNLPALTNSNELNILYSSGITTTIPNQPIDISLVVDGNIQIYQFQLHFTYIPNNQQISPLSIFIEDKAVYLLEPVTSAVPSLKNIKFIYENTNSLNNIKISIITNGDIYLTSLAGSSIIISPTNPPINPTTPLIPSNNNNTPALTIGLSVGICSLAIISVVALTLFIRSRKLNEKNNAVKMKDIENIETKKENTTTATTTTTTITVSGIDENNTIIPLQSTSTQPTTATIITTTEQPVFAPTPTEEPFVSPILNMEPSFISPEPNANKFAVSYRPIDFSKPNQTEKGRRIIMPKPTVMYSSFPTVSTNISETKITYIPLSLLALKKRQPTEVYITHPNIISALGQLKEFQNNDPGFPLQFETSIMDPVKGKKCKVGETYIDSLRVTNTTNKNQSGVLIFPVDNHTGICTSISDYFHIKANQTSYINIGITLTCTTNYIQNFAIVIEEIGYTLITVHMESELSVKLDFNELGFDEFLGEGTFGIVFKGTWRSQVVAIKFLKVKCRIKNIDQVYRELDILGKLRSKYIVSFIGGIVSAENFCIVTEHIENGNLGDLIHVKKHVLTDKQKVRFAIDICKGMEFIHQCGILHRDLKPDNILVVSFNANSPVCVKISDFGTSKESNEINLQFTQAIGTPIYMSSEVLEKKIYNKSTDVHSFAITLYELMTGIVPYSEIKNYWDIPSQIMEGYRPTLGLDTIDTRIKDIIVRGWGPSINRPSFGQMQKQLESIFESYPEADP